MNKESKLFFVYKQEQGIFLHDHTHKIARLIHKTLYTMSVRNIRPVNFVNLFDRRFQWRRNAIAPKVFENVNNRC